MKRFSNSSFSLIHGVFPVLAQFANTLKMLGMGLAFTAACRRLDWRARPNAGRLALIGLAFGSVAAAQTASFSSGAISVIPSLLDGNGSLAVDANGNFYTPAPGGVYKYTLSGGGYTQSTLAFGLNQPVAVAVDGSGNLYVASLYSQVVKATPSGSSYTTSTITADVYQASSIVVDAGGNIFIYCISSISVPQILKETPSSDGYTESVIASGLGDTGVLAADPTGSIYVANTDGDEVLKLTPNGGSYSQSVVAGSISYPEAVAVDGNGNVYIGDTTEGKILKETPSSGGYTQSVIPINDYINGGNLAVDGGGNLYAVIDDPYDPSSGVLVAVQTGAVNFGAVNVASTSSTPIQLVFTIGTAGTLGATTVVSDGQTGFDFTDAGNSTNTCSGSAVAAGGTCTVEVNFAPERPGIRFGAVNLTNSSGGVIATGYVEGTGVGPQVTFLPGTQSSIGSGLSSPGGIAAGSGNVFIANTGSGSVLIETFNGGGAGSYTQTTLPTSGLQAPGGVAVDGAGNVYIADYTGNAVYEETLSGTTYTQSTVVTGLNAPTAVAVDGGGNLYIVNSGTAQVFKETLAGGSYAQSTIGSGLVAPYGVAVDGSGNVYISDPGTPAVLKETLSGSTYTQSTIGSGLDDPEGITVDVLGNVYISDYGLKQVLEEAYLNGGYAQSVVSTAGLMGPAGVAKNAKGDIFIADYLGNAVYRENLSTAPSVVFATPTPSGRTDTVDGYQTVTFVNSGNAPLLIESVTVPNTGDFLVAGGEGNDCSSFVGESTGVAAGQSCILPISFIPQTTGSISGNVLVTDNSLNAAGPTYVNQKITASGTGSSDSPTITSVSPIVSAQSQTITIAGSGFGTQAAYTGDSSYIGLTDSTNPFTAGHTGNGVTLAVSSWTDSQIVLSGLSGSYGTTHCIRPGDSLSISVWNAQTGDGPSVYSLVASGGTDHCPTSITSVSPIVSAATQTITITGEGFGTEAAYTGDSNYIEFVDNSGTPWSAGYTGKGIGLAISSWTDSQIVITGFSGSYGTAHCIRPGDNLSLTVWNAQTGTGTATYSLVASGTTDNCPTSIASVSPIISSATQTITISGEGFGTEAAYTGDSAYIQFTDNTGTPWSAGHTGNGIDLGVSSWTDKQIVLTGFSGAYGTTHCIRPGDSLSITVWNAQTGTGTASYSLVASGGTDNCPTKITSVSAILPQQTQTITITGEGFGTHAAYTGDSNYIQVTDSTRSWNAGYTGNGVTLGVTSWTDSQIVLSGFAGSFGPNHCIAPGDHLSLSVWNAQTGAGPVVYPVVATSGSSTCP